MQSIKSIYRQNPYPNPNFHINLNLKPYYNPNPNPYSLEKLRLEQLSPEQMLCHYFHIMADPIIENIFHMNVWFQRELFQSIKITY